MALPPLTRYLYNNANDDILKRAKKIQASGQVDVVEFDGLSNAVVFRVKDDVYPTFYKVYINSFKEEKNMSLRCGCPYNPNDICKHKAASLLQLQEMLDKNIVGAKDNSYNQKHTVLKIKTADIKTIRLFTAPQSFLQAQDFLATNKPEITQAADEKVVAKVKANDGIECTVVIQKNEERNFDTSCNCNTETHHPLCLHKAIVFLFLHKTGGITYFDTIRSWDKVKNKLLSMYGYSLADNLKGKFEFVFKDGKPFLRVLDTSIKRVNAPLEATRPAEEVKKVLSKEFKIDEEEQKEIKPAQRLGVIIVNNPKQYPYVQLDAVIGDANEAHNAFIGKVEKVDLTKYIDAENLEDTDKEMLPQLRKLLGGEVSRYLNRNTPFGSEYADSVVQPHDDELNEETRQLINEYLHPKYKAVFTALNEDGITYSLPPKKPFTTQNLQPAIVSAQALQPQFTINKTKTAYEVACEVNTEVGYFNVSENEFGSSFIFKKDNYFFGWKNADDILLVEKFLPAGTLIIEAADWQQQLQDFILPLSKDYQVDFGNLRRNEIRDVKPEIKLLLKEKGDYLVFKPLFTYRGYEIKTGDKDKVVVPSGDELNVINRNKEAENTFMKRVEALHSSFVKTDDGDAFALKGIEVLKNNWFFLFTDAMKDLQVPVFGFESLKNFKFNTSKPNTKIYISSNTDWFDAKVEIFFGEHKVTVADVKHALVNKQQFVPLSDGTLGILPEEWIKKYSLLFRVGEAKDAGVKLSKYHFGIIDQLYEERNEEELFFQLENKYENLKDNHQVKEIEAPENLKPILRPYQLSGFQWLNYLNDVQWGGILADDMGLGKTIQTLCFLSYLKTKNNSLKALVVCPTTLLFNWENEIKKFTPTLTFGVHHGSARGRTDKAFIDNEIVITTYGTLRSDIKLFSEIEFDYIVLDESQAIKNPASKVTKAAGLIKAKNRLCLSGTPLQNNTFDIYAQMNFLNPGMLGSMEFFKQEFAIPIDKFGEKEQKEHLRKLLYPFILRRTKEQVAKDLPEKQEMILYCEMGDEQQKIYDAYRNEFRDKIMGVVEAQGIGRSQLTILQGLMKLRQICDSPFILNEEEQYPNVSVKLDELTREITENISNHKALVFSQFLGMLALIRDRLEELGVPYAYFDGSTSAPDRQKAVEYFQNNEECRVFLISLKAGGVGLNLTAADYVYIVDPWWNPAVEQQAIDRTHRIGQTKNIFAYRMICKDTVEDKIINLQERKKALAKDLITDDEGFVKSLTKADVEYLFS